MKKLFGLVMFALLVFLPISTKAAVSIMHNCGAADENGVITCTIAYNISGDAIDSLKVTLTEKGGAEVIDVMDANESEWSISTKNETNGVWNVELTSVGLSGEGNLFTFSYRPSGEEDCEVQISLNGQTTVVTPPGTPEPTPETPNDTPTDNKQTGATLPYVALGAIVVISTGAYFAIRNKTKMYKI